MQHVSIASWVSDVGIDNWISTFLFLDTLIGFMLAALNILTAQTMASRVRRMAILICFPWLALLLFVGEHFKSLSKDQVRVTLVFLTLFGLLLLIIGSWTHTDLLLGALAFLFWVYVLSTMRNHPGDDDRDEDDPDSPTPHGDAIDLWLRSLQKVKL